MTNEPDATPDWSAIAADLGVTLLPWQRSVLDAWAEARRSGGRLAIVSMPRRPGRNLLAQVWEAGRDG